MAGIIRDGRIIGNNWRLLDPAAWMQVGETGLLPDFPEGKSLLAPLRLWQLRRDDLLAHRGPVGVMLEPADDPEAIAADVGRLALIAVNFPQFTDGRGYSTARLLRERHGYRGELRAVGDVQRDQLYCLARCGFNAFALRDGEDVDAALAAFNDFSDAYQAAVDRPQPLFRRRLARAAGEAEGLSA
jgi:uncharacterized protein (DUF934 family)